MLLHYLSLPHKNAILSAILYIEMNFVHCFASFLQIFSLFVFPPSPGPFIPILVFSSLIRSDAQIKALLTFEMKPVSRLNSNYSHFKIHFNDSHLISLL